MEELGSLWSYQENIEELKQKLLYTTLELESLKIEASEEIRKNKENVKNLLHLLKMANQERDEARNQLQKIINKITPNLLLHPESPTILIPPTTTKANSSITESNSLSETHNSSPVDSFFDSDSSPDFSNTHMADSTQMGHFVPAMTGDDPATSIIDNFVKGKALPQKGKLLQSVMEAGPLLQTLLVAGPLPRWRNPPPLQPFKIPPVSIKGCGEKGIMTSSNSSISSFPYYGEISRGTPQMCSAAMLNFNGVGGPAFSASCYGNNGLMVQQSSSTNYYHQPAACKRQRF